DKRHILNDPQLKKLLGAIKDQPPQERAAYGQAVNKLRHELSVLAEELSHKKTAAELEPIDVTAPFDINVPAQERPQLFGPADGSLHPITQELDRIKDIFIRMGFSVEESRLIDDDYHMFGSLNFPQDHPARDEYDTFITEEGFILPAHTS